MPRASLSILVLLVSLQACESNRTLPDRGTAEADSVRLELACDTCQIRWTQALVLGDSAGPGFVAEPVAVVRDGRGRWVVASATPGLREELRVFGSDGTFLRTVGRKGKGPGEYTWAGGLAVTAGDTLHVFDQGNARETALSPSLDVLWTRQIPGGYLWDQVLIDSTRTVVNAIVGTAEAAGYPLHLIRGDGDIERSFGARQGAPFRYDVPYTVMRRLSRASDQRIWSARINQYLIELWDLNGRRLEVLWRDVPWFESWWQGTSPTPETPPQPTLIAVHQDRDGRLWVLVLIPDPEWKAMLESQSRQTPEGSRTYTGELDALHDTMVEVLDPNHGRVLASQRLPMAVTGFAADGYAYSYTELEGGYPQIHVWHLELD